MEILMAIVIGILFMAAVYLILSRSYPPNYYWDWFA